MQLKRYIAGLLVVILAMCVIPATCLEANAAANSKNAISIGIDVSKYQGNINWAAVKQSGVGFAFAKIGSSKSGIDPTFIKNVVEANAVGIRCGGYIYSYATNVNMAMAEAQMCIQACAALPVSFPIAFDIEDTVHKGLSPAQQQEIVNTFCTMIEAAGYYPIVYASKAWYTNRLGETVWDQWVAQYNTECNYPGKTDIWQFTESGKVSGIAGNVDMDYLYKNFAAYIIQEGWITRKGFNYFYRDWHMQTGWINYAGAIWYTDPAGRMLTGWLDIEANGNMRYFHPNGPMAIGMTPIGNAMYYFAADGVMQKGWQNIGAARYFFADNGQMVFNWMDTPMGKYYFGPDGIMRVGYVAIDGALYFFGMDGIMQTGWANVAGALVYLGEDGKAKTGWFNVGADSFYAMDNGACLAGWQAIGNTFFHFDEKNAALSKNQILPFIDGNPVYVGADGTIQTGWQQIGGAMYYFQENGVQAINTTILIDGIPWLFDINGIGVQLDPAAIDNAEATAK